MNKAEVIGEITTYLNDKYDVDEEVDLDDLSSCVEDLEEADSVEEETK